MILNFYYSELLNFTLWKQCTEAQDCSLIHGQLCTCNSIQRNKTDEQMFKC
jgi:hypothetical protein